MHLRTSVAPKKTHLCLKMNSVLLQFKFALFEIRTDLKQLAKMKLKLFPTHFVL